jgi:hypothetical protein
MTLQQDSAPDGAAWASYQNDFDAMSDEEVAYEARRARETVAVEEDWLEAVAAWEAAGRPRSPAKKEEAK